MNNNTTATQTTSVHEFWRTQSESWRGFWRGSAGESWNVSAGFWRGAAGRSW